MIGKFKNLFAVLVFAILLSLNGYVVAGSFLGWADWDIGPLHYMTFRTELVIFLAIFVGIGLSRIKWGLPPFFDRT